MKLPERTFARFRSDLRRILGDNLHDIIIHGSYALDDFRPNKGDLDYLVVTSDDLAGDVCSALFDLHDGYRSAGSLLLHQLEGAFYTRSFLAGLDAPFSGCYIGTGRAGWRPIHELRNSFIDLRIVGTAGISLLGRTTEIYRPSEAEILSEQRDQLEGQRSSLRGSPGRSFGFCVSAAHWCGRTLYYRSSSRIASKSEGCRWARLNVERDDFRRLFALAESLRYPYPEHGADAGLRSTCRDLLEYVASVLRGEREASAGG